MSDERPNEVSSYLAYLPALFQEVGPDGTSVLGRFLLAFEEVLTGLGGATQPGLEEILDGRLKRTDQGWEPDADTGVQRYFTPGPAPTPDDRRAPDEFLDWLAGWVALTLQPGWEAEEKRRLMARIVPLYQRRGTLAGLADLLSAYTGGMEVDVMEFRKPFQVGVNSRVGTDALIGETPPHYFAVRIVLRTAGEGTSLSLKRQMARQIIDQEKPAHTRYDLFTVFPDTIQVGVVSRVGKDTLLGRK